MCVGGTRISDPLQNQKNAKIAIIKFDVFGRPQNVRHFADHPLTNHLSA